MKKLLFVLLLIFSANGFSQLSKTHYIPPISCSDGVTPRYQYIYVSTPSPTNVSFTITSIGGIAEKHDVSRDTPYRYEVGQTNDSQLFFKEGDVTKVLSNKGFIIEAEDLVYVNVRVADDSGGGTPAHAGSLVSKGMAALGTQFRVGGFLNTALADSDYKNIHYTFASILATENNTTVTFQDIKPGATLVNNVSLNSKLTLNRGESYVIAVKGGSNNLNKDALIGAGISSTKPIVVNCGSFVGTNGPANGQDIGIDQIVPAERTGKKYIFVKGKGQVEKEIEKIVLIANEDGTEFFLNGDPNKSLGVFPAGRYKTFNANDFINGSLYVTGSKNFFAYQGLGGTDEKPNQNMHFVPPLSCETPKVIDNIPFINKVGDMDFPATINIVTENNAVLKLRIDGNEYLINALPSGVTKVGPNSVTGNPDYQVYIVSGLKGNVSVISDKQVYASFFGTSGAATYGGYYSGFIYKPEINFNKLNATSAYCLPNVKLSVNDYSASYGNPSSYDFKWYKNGNEILGATSSSYQPTTPGSYYVEATVKNCPLPARRSDEIPVSVCLQDKDSDTDGVNDTVDMDNDNDGIANCDESWGDADINTLGNSGTIVKGSYSNAYNKVVTFTGNSNYYVDGAEDGTIISQLDKGVNNSVTQTFTFAQPVSLALEYAQTAGATNWLNANGDFVLEVPQDKNILVLNPDDQLLIDTNYDGIYESGVTNYSSFQVRFRLKDPTNPLAAGTGTFKFLARLVSTFSLTHKNLSETKFNNAIFRLKATCLPKDSDGDGIVDEMDKDDDNDGILTEIETRGKDYVVVSFTDTDKNGVNDAYGSGLALLDSDGDGVYNQVDLDSDNDGIYDLVEAGFTGIDTDNDGMVDPGKTAPALDLTKVDTDSDKYQNFIDSDSDDDGCKDVIEAGFTDPNGDGYLGGDNPVVVNAKGVVIAPGVNSYATVPNGEYLIPGKITANTFTDKTICAAQNTSFEITANADGYQWQVSSDGTTYNPITDDTTYTGSTTNKLQISNAQQSMNGYKYRVVLSKNHNMCGFTSLGATLTVNAVPAATPVVTYEKCDYDADGSVDFDLTSKESEISSNHSNETFTYFTSLTAAQTKDANFKISNPGFYVSSNGNKVWARIENASSCFAISEIDLVVSVNQLKPSAPSKLSVCDDYVDASHNDKDGIATFNFQTATDEITASLPSGPSYTVKYYKTEKDALNQVDAQGNSLAITNVNNYRNIGSPNTQIIYVRISSNGGGSCDGIGPYLELTVNPLPNIELNHREIICSGQTESVEINAGLISGSPSDYTYTWTQNGQPMAAQDYSVVVSDDATYVCIVKDPQTGCESKRTNTVVHSGKATIENVEILDLAVNNKVIVTVSGAGEYEYGLDSETGPFQDNHILEKVAPGTHVLYINDKNGCGVVPKNISVMGAPAFFTPNGDGVNENWNMRGVTPSLVQNSKIDIFDRYGKLLYVITDLQSEGWDGTYNGNILPSDDYWFVVYLTDGKTLKGHFTLKR